MTMLLLHMLLSIVMEGLYYLRFSSVMLIQTLGKESVWPLLAAESLKALGGLGILSFGGQVFLRRIFEVTFRGCHLA